MQKKGGVKITRQLSLHRHYLTYKITQEVVLKLNSKNQKFFIPGYYIDPVNQQAKKLKRGVKVKLLHISSKII